jgi:DNA-directed RNA polymerase specialized sigma24 family protein
MSSADAGSVTVWLGDLETGGDAAAQRLWERYFHRLVLLARDTLRVKGRSDPVEDEEDAALSAFASFCRGVTRGRFPRLADRDDLWRLLVVITVRKALDQARRRRSKKRGAGRLVGEAGLAGPDATEPGGSLDLFAGRDPNPALAALVAEEYCKLRDALGDDSLRRVLDLRLEGYIREEIAAEIGCTVRTVTRKLDVIRSLWCDEDRP